MARSYRSRCLRPSCIVSLLEATFLIHSELGLATHYINADSIPSVVHEITQLSDPTFAQISAIISASSPPPSASESNSKKNPDGHTAIKGDIRRFLDKTFKHDNVNAIYEGLQNAESDESLSAEVKAWAKEQKAHMDMRSPTGMAVALEGYRRAVGAKRLDVVLQGGEWLLSSKHDSADLCRYVNGDWLRCKLSSFPLGR